MAIEIIPKEAKKFPLWQNILFYFSLVLLLASLSGFFVLNYFQKKSQATLDDLRKTIEKGFTAEEKTLEKELLSYQKKIEDFSTLFLDYRLTSKLFGFFEKLIHPKVFFTDFSLDPKLNKLSLSGQTENFETLGQQILIFQKEEKIKSLDLKEIGISKEGKIEFSLDISFIPLVFTQ